MALRAYYDGSTGRRREVVSLAGIWGHESVWPQFESGWLGLLKKYEIREFHMADAIAQRGPFTNWTQQRACSFVSDAFRLLRRFRSAPDRLSIRSCSVDMKDHASVAAQIPLLRSAEAMVVDYCVGGLNEALTAKELEGERPITLYFDANERFMNVIFGIWQRERNRPGWPRQMREIRSVTASEPAIQAVDIYAWLSNRRHTIGDYTNMFSASSTMTRHLHRYYNRALMLSVFDSEGNYHEEYVRRPD